MTLLEQIAEYIVELTKDYNSYITITHYSINNIIIRIMIPDVLIIVSPTGVRVKYWREEGGWTVEICRLNFDFGDPTMIDTIVNKLKEWASMKLLTEYA